MKWGRPTRPAGHPGYPLAGRGYERTAALQDAGNRFDAIYDQQRGRLAGFYARLGRGLCWKDLGESEKAFAIFEELLGLPDDPADFHALRGKAAVQALETSLRPDVKKYKQGLDIAQRWLGADQPQSASGEVDLAVRFLGGEAALAYLKTLPAASPEQSELRTRQIDWARQQFRIVAATAGPRAPSSLVGEGQDPSARSGVRPCAGQRTGDLCRRPQSCRGGLGAFPRRPGRAARGRAQRRGQRSRFTAPTPAADRHRAKRGA